MKYEHRWFYALFMLLIMCLCGYIYLLQPALVRLGQLKQTETELNLEWAKIKSHVKQKSVVSRPSMPTKPLTQAALLSRLFTEAHASGLQIESLQGVMREQTDSHQGVKVKAVVHGDFLQLLSWMLALSQQSYPIFVLDFSYQASTYQQSIFIVSLFMLNGVAPNREEVYGEERDKRKQNPFCFGESRQDFSYENESASMRATSIKQLKMVGYFQQDEQKQALFLYPNDRVIAVSPGDKVGKERGVVAHIEQGQVSIRLPDNQTIVMERLNNKK